MKTQAITSIDAIIEQMIEAKLAALQRFEWVHWREWARSPRHARRIGEREGIRLTKIGRELFGHRADLHGLAERNMVPPASVSDPSREASPHASISPRIAAAFGLKRT